MKFFLSLVCIIVLSICVPTVYASTTLGTIDPRGVGNWKAVFEHSALAGAPTINVGKFTTQSSKNITVSSTELRGFMFSEGVGWIVTNCADTTSGCSGTNGNFKVANDGTGKLSGYAWGENTGWINFGPFTNSAISTVKITNGFFGGTLGSAGYAWTQNYGWIKFDCSNAASCVETDWRPSTTTPPSGGGGGTTGGTTTPACRDGEDNDGDGMIDSLDPGCHTDGDATNPASYDPQDQNEFNSSRPAYCELVPSAPECQLPLTAVCDDGIDNDQDGLIDYPQDPGCTSLSDSSEEDPTIAFCIQNPTDPSCTTPSEPPFCDVHPLDPSCSWVCDRFPSFPTCTVIGPGNGGTTTPPTHTSTSGGGSTIISLPIVRFLTWTGISLPIASSIASFLVSNPIALKDVPLIVMQIWNAFLVAIGWKRRKKPWGVVYDSQTKRPIDPAYVVLVDTNGTEVATAITDINGRYGFAVDPGTYRIMVNKTNYQFPSTVLSQTESDGLYEDLYFGGDVVVSNEGEIITKNIPLDQIGFDWNEYTKQMGGTYGMKLSFYRVGDRVLFHISRIIFMVGFAYAIYTCLFFPVLYNIIILALYVALSVLQFFVPVFHVRGSVLSKETKRPEPFSIVRIISAITNKEVGHKVADRLGNYYGLVQNGLYTFRIDTKKQGDKGYIPHETHTYVRVKRGYLKETFKI